VAVLGATVVLLVALTAPRAPGSVARPSIGAAPIEGSITVLAASSLTEAFTRLGRVFEKRNPGVEVRLSFNASALLATQVMEGAPADVFASADQATMARVVDEHLVENAPTLFARNRLAIAVEPGNPQHIRELADTVKSDRILVLCAREAPCGRYARQVFRRAGVSLPEVATVESSKAALAKVEIGEVDAAVVYATDVRAAGGRVDGITIPADENVVARYPIAVLRDSEDVAAARAFVRFVASRTGQGILASFGFGSP
jgi:molybdate transport system substrate-binding protein